MWLLPSHDNVGPNVVTEVRQEGSAMRHALERQVVCGQIIAGRVALEYDKQVVTDIARVKSVRIDERLEGGAGVAAPREMHYADLCPACVQPYLLRRYRVRASRQGGKVTPRARALLFPKTE